MAYAQHTKHYCLPVLGYGDTIEPETELRKWQSLENFILACMRGEETAIFQEGGLELETDGDRMIRVVMYPGGSGVICRGIAGGRYFDAKSRIQWRELKPGTFYYLYISTNDQTFEDPASFDVSTSIISTTSSQKALVATVDLRGDTYTIDRYPPGKNCPTMLGAHIADNEDPHGEILHQTNIAVKNNFEAENGFVRNLRVDSLVVGDTEVRFDGRHYRTEVEEVTIPSGETVLTGNDAGRVVFVQSLDPRIVFAFKDGDLVANNPLKEPVTTSIMLTIE